MLDVLFNWLVQFFGGFVENPIRNSIILAAVIVAIWAVRRWWRHRRRTVERLTPDLTIDLKLLADAGPPAGPPSLEFYHLPVRLAAVVLAPVGIDRELPSPALLSALYDTILPGLDKVVALHQPMIRRWPKQVSTRGFAHAFFSHLHLPGQGGKGTPWSAAAGLCKFSGLPVMVGLVLRAAAPNSLGQVTINAEHEWLGCLRVKGAV
jgi:hypothetical protein